MWCGDVRSMRVLVADTTGPRVCLIQTPALARILVSNSSNRDMQRSMLVVRAD